MSYEEAGSGSSEQKKKKMEVEEEGFGSSEERRKVVVAAVFQINTSVASFRRLVQSLGTSKDSPQLREKIHKTEQHIEKLAKETLARLKAVSDTDYGNEPLKKVADRKLAKDFETVLKDFQNAQRTAKKHWSSLPVVSGTSIYNDELHWTAQETLKQEEQKSLLLAERRQEMVALETERLFNDAIIEEREQGIQEIQQQIGEVHEIFKDLAVLVHEQGIMIDDIDSNIGNAHASTNQANRQITKASQTQRSTSSLACLLLVIFAVALMILIIVLVA